MVEPTPEPHVPEAAASAGAAPDASPAGAEAGAPAATPAGEAQGDAPPSPETRPPRRRFRRISALLCVLAGVACLFAALLASPWAAAAALDSELESAEWWTLLGVDVVLAGAAGVCFRFRASDRLARWVWRLGLPAAPLAFGCLTLVLFGDAWLDHLPLNLKAYLEGPREIVAQSSKREVEPRDYLLLSGDSYAEGAGDWVRSVSGWSNAPFQATHVVYERTGVDVITFGESGAGSAMGYVERPIGFLEALNKRYTIGKPTYAALYFYAGNDLTDNIRRLESWGMHDAWGGKAAAPLDRAEFRKHAQLLVEMASNRVPKGRAGAWILRRFVGGAVRKLLPQPAPPPPPPGPPPPMINNEVVFNGGTQVLNSPLQGPGLVLREDEWNLSLEVVDESLAMFREAFPDVPTVVVFLPSSSGCHEHVLGEVTTEDLWGRHAIHPAEQLFAVEKRARDRVEALATRHGMSFRDATPAIRELVRKGGEDFPYGPTDWNHFNRVGNIAIAEIVIEALGLSSAR